MPRSQIISWTYGSEPSRSILIDRALGPRYEIAPVKMVTPSLVWADEPMTFPQMLNLNCVVQRDPDVIAAEADQDLVMVSIANGLYYGVSDVAREIWDAIERPKKISDLIDDLVGTYNIDRTTCKEETLSFLEDLRAEGLLKVSDEPVS
jgi:hypothetical protein